MDEQKIFEIIGKPVFGWILSKLFDKGFDWLKRKKIQEKDEFVEIVENIISKHYDDNLKQEYFVSLFQDEDVKKNLKAFEEGYEEISLDLLTETINKIVYGGAEDKKVTSLIIVKDLFDEIRSFVFNDPFYANHFAYSLTMQLKKTTNTYGQNIIKSLSEIDYKIDKGFAKTDENLANVMNKIDALIATKQEPLENIKNSEINSIIKIANDFMKDGKILSARKIYLDLLTKVDKEEKNLLWRLNSNIGKSYLNEFNDQDGVKYFEDAYKLFPNEQKGLLQLAYARLIDHNTTEGLKTVEEILKINQDSEEALVVKCNLYLLNGNYNDAIDSISKTKLNTFETLYTYGFVLNKKGDNEKAKEYLLKALEYQRVPIALDLLTVTILDSLMVSYRLNRPLRIQKNSPLYLSTCEALKYLDEAILILEKREEKKQLATVYHNRGIVYSLMHEKEKSLYDLKTSKELGLDEGIVYLNLGIAYIQNSDLDNAEKCFTRAKELEEPNALNYLLNVLILKNNLTKAKDIILHNIRGDLSDLNANNLMSYLVLSEIYERELNDTESKRIIDELKKEFSKNIIVIDREVVFNCNHGNIDTAITILEENINGTVEKNEYLLFVLADLYFQIKSWEKSSELLSNLINNDEFGPVERRYLYSLTNQGKYAKALEFISNLESSIDINIEDIQKVKGDIFLFYEKFSDSKEVFKRLATNYRKAEYYIKWGLSEFRIGELETATVILNSAEKDFKDKPKDLLRISSAYSFLGKTKEALEIAFKVLQDLPDDLDTVKNYLMIFLSHTQQNPKDEVDNRMKIAFKNNMDSFEKKFPDDKSWQKMEVGENFEELKNMLREQEKYLQQINQLYDFHKLPLSMVSKLVQRNIFETWGGFINRTDRKIWAFSDNNSKKEYNLIREYCSEIVIEPIAFFTLYNVNQIGLLTRFSKCYFPQRLLDVLMHEVNMMRMNLNSGLFTVYSLNGQLYKNEIPVWEVENNIKKLLDMIEFIKGKTFGYEAVEKAPYSEDKMFDFLDDTLKQAIQFSLERKIPLLIDESSILELFQAKYNLQGFSTLTLFRVARAAKMFTTHDYNSILLKLIPGNYYFISINADIIRQGLKEHGFKMSFASQNILKYLNQPDINEESVAVVLAELFIILYSEEILPLRRDCWLDYALDCLPRNSINTTALLKLILDRVVIHYKGIINYQYVIKWLDNSLRTWAITRAVPYFK